MPEAKYPGGVLRRGGRGPAVKRVQDRLKACGFDPGPPDGVFGPLTEAAVKDFQERHDGPDKRPLVVDGVVGPLTWGALFGEVVSDAGLSEPAPPGSLAATIVEVACGQVGSSEDPPGTNWGNGIPKYLRAVGLDSSAQWCQGFAWWCALEAAKRLGHSTTRWPQPSASTCTTFRDAQKLGWSYKPAEVMAGTKTIRPGDFVYTKLRWREWHGHVGIVEKVEGFYVHTIEGNTSNKVWRRRHKLSDLAGFVRLR